MIRRLTGLGVPLLRIGGGATHRGAVGSDANGRDLLGWHLGAQFQGETDGALRMDLRGKELEACRRDTERLGATAELLQRDRLPNRLVPESSRAVKRFGRPGHPFLRQLGREDAARVAQAAAHPFHIDNSPTRVTPRGRLGTMASEMA